MRKIAASYIFPIVSPPIKNGILIVGDDGNIVEVIHPQGPMPELENLEYYNGIIIPGFVNSHCHLELSHFHNKIEQGTGLGTFIGNISKLRKEGWLDDRDAAQKADDEMWLNGIMAVGDISNSLASIDIKKKSKIRYHTFAEVYGFMPERAERAFNFGKDIYEFCQIYDLPASVTPHSPYSVSNDLFLLIKDFVVGKDFPISIHNQESKGENDFFRTGGGEIANHLQNNLGLDISEWRPTGKNSLPSVLEKLPENNNLLLVHNTFTEESDLRFLKSQRNPTSLFFVLCPNANLYITGTLPPVNLFRQYGLNLCLGTDSLASNTQLSVLAEMVTLQKYFPEIGLPELVSWATLNGAKALGMDHTLGSFEPGKKPGVILLENVDLQNFKILEETRMKRLV